MHWLTPRQLKILKNYFKRARARRPPVEWLVERLGLPRSTVYAIVSRRLDRVPSHVNRDKVRDTYIEVAADRAARGETAIVYAPVVSAELTRRKQTRKFRATRTVSRRVEKGRKLGKVHRIYESRLISSPSQSKAAQVALREEKRRRR